MTFDFQELTAQLERVHSGRLALRQVCLADAWPLYEATRNPRFNEFLLWPQPNEELHVLKRIDAITQAVRAGRMSAISAVVRKTGEWVSLFRFQRYAANEEFLEMGIWTHDRFWRGRYSYEVGQVCVDAAFSLSNVETLVAASYPENRGSMHLMHQVGLTPGRMVIRETEMDCTVELMEFHIRRSQWKALTRDKPFHAFGHESTPSAAETAPAEQTAAHLSPAGTPSP
jgi:RimJ/RimL family protein N-acetyltransferase